MASLLEFYGEGCPPCPPPQTESLHDEGSAWLQEPEKANMKAAWEIYLSRPGLQQAMIVMVSLARHQAFREALTDDTLDAIFWLSAGTGWGDVGIEAEKFVENIAGGGGRTAERVEVMHKR